VASDLLPSVMARVVLTLSRSDAYQRGRMYGWDYEQIRVFHLARLRALAPLLQGNQAAFLDASQELWNLYGQNVHMLAGPYAGCTACHEPCHYRYDLAPLANDASLKQEWRLILNDGSHEENVFAGWMTSTRQALRTYLDDDHLPDSPELLVCLSSQGLALLGLSSASQRRLMDRLCAYL
jgi:hypothetical protein